MKAPRLPQDRSSIQPQSSTQDKKAKTRAINEQSLGQLLESIEQETGYEAVREFRFHGDRKWRFDVAWPQVGVALEIDGGVWSRGRHVRPLGYLNDVEKLNAANLLHWHVFRTDWQSVKNGEALKLMVEALRGAYA